ncbi:MAG: hypothetical protein HBSAPP01_25480 [Candidatus Brocadia sapporoensis]|nr:MAG: hypothetical protein HBSAPP01_25480 [Candidatus Brocadia sapporoensis]
MFTLHPIDVFDLADEAFPINCIDIRYKYAKLLEGTDTWCNLFLYGCHIQTERLPRKHGESSGTAMSYF